MPINPEMKTLNLCLFLFQVKDSQKTRKTLRKIWWKHFKKIIIISVAILLSIIIILLSTNVIPTWPFSSPSPIGTNKLLHVITVLQPTIIWKHSLVVGLEEERFGSISLSLKCPLTCRRTHSYFCNPSCSFTLLHFSRILLLKRTDSGTRLPRFNSPLSCTVCVTVDKLVNLCPFPHL